MKAPALAGIFAAVLSHLHLPPKVQAILVLIALLGLTALLVFFWLVGRKST